MNLATARHTRSRCMHQAEIVDRSEMPLLRRQRELLQRLAVVPLDAEAVEVHEPEIELAVRVPGPSCPLKELRNKLQ